MLKRKIENTLAEWKKTKTNQGILITGARQVGKTSIIERFAANHYDNLVKIDFVEQPDAVAIIEGAHDLNDLIVRITALASRPLSEGKTLLFFDEIQRCGDAVTWMRYLANDERFDVAYSGSLLGIEAYDYRSLPVGTIDIYEMFPLDFQEFCWAMGIDDALWSALRESFQAEREVPQFLHERFMDLFYRYLLVGGMPDTVQTFVSTHDTQAMRARQKSIVSTYRADITRYVKDPSHAQRIKTIYDAIPAQLNKENRRFVVSGIDKKRRFDELQPDFDWLSSAGVALPVKRVSEPVFPLGLGREDSFFKFYMNDTGLLFSTLSSASVEAVLARKEEINFGQVFENAIAQELRAHGFESLYYFNAKNTGEVDFLIEKPGVAEVLPIEVKSGKYSTKHAALDRLLSVDNYKIDEAVVLHTFNVARKGKVLYLPIYMAAFFEE